MHHSWNRIYFTKSEKLRTYPSVGKQQIFWLLVKICWMQYLQTWAKNDQNSAFINHGVERRICSCKKYQKTQNLLNDILLKYAEKSGSAEAIRGKSNTRMIAFYSPAGGSGKTALSLGLASSMAAEGEKGVLLKPGSDRFGQ